MIQADNVRILRPAWRERKYRMDERIAAQLPKWRDQIKHLIEQHGDSAFEKVTVSQIYGGLRGVTTIVSDISYVDPEAGIRLRGYTIKELLELLPKAEGTEIPMAGGLYYLLLVGELPTFEDAMIVENTWHDRSTLPSYLLDIINAMPRDTHPMILFSQSIMALQRDSVFSRRYQEGMHKEDYWEATLEDSLNLTAKLPSIAALIYNHLYREGELTSPSEVLDWSANFAHMIGKGNDLEYHDLCRLFFIIHSDHEGANASAHTARLVNSTLADVYYACSAGLNALAGPLHGLANQACLKWLLGVYNHFNGLPTKEQLKTYAEKQLKKGHVIPGYGHAVLRTTDARFTAQRDFALEHLPEDEIFQLVERVYEVVPDILMATGKVKNPWPNVDAINGTLQYHYGVKEFEFYTVLFGMSRIMGFTAGLVWDRAIGKPIERPKSITTKRLSDFVESEQHQ
ncbi:MAG: citrate (Si)-synthase [Anaerolineaceae bacterium]|nr:citrate (Si)-synthase [Anaerolineaceae bacterium]